MKLISNARVAKLCFLVFFLCVFFTRFSFLSHAFNWGVLANRWYYLGEDYRSDEWESEHQIEESVRAINELRVHYGKNPLSIDPVLMNAAEIRAKEIVTKFEHFRPDGTRPFTATDGVYQYVGENLGRGQTSTVQIMEDWLNSPEHRKNIFLDEYTRIGVATYKQDGKTHWVHLFLAE